MQNNSCRLTVNIRFIAPDIYTSKPKTIPQPGNAEGIIALYTNLRFLY
jgi:hypothetical protein